MKAAVVERNSVAVVSEQYSVVLRKFSGVVAAVQDAGVRLKTLEACVEDYKWKTGREVSDVVVYIVHDALKRVGELLEELSRLNVLLKFLEEEEKAEEEVELVEAGIDG